MNLFTSLQSFLEHLVQEGGQQINMFLDPQEYVMYLYLYLCLYLYLFEMKTEKCGEFGFYQ